jgi:uncharacterized membrane protein YccC
MKKIIFYISLTASFFILVNSINLFVIDYKRFTEFTFGFIVGKIILLFIFMTLMFITKSKKTKKNIKKLTSK